MRNTSLERISLAVCFLLALQLSSCGKRLVIDGKEVKNAPAWQIKAAQSLNVAKATYRALKKAVLDKCGRSRAEHVSKCRAMPLAQCQKWHKNCRYVALGMGHYATAVKIAEAQIKLGQNTTLLKRAMIIINQIIPIAQELLKRLDTKDLKGGDATIIEKALSW